MTLCRLLSCSQGIHCRFGMASVIAEAHFDGGRNFVALVKGRRRYILNEPAQCSCVPMCSAAVEATRIRLCGLSHALACRCRRPSCSPSLVAFVCVADHTLVSVDVAARLALVSLHVTDFCVLAVAVNCTL